MHRGTDEAWAFNAYQSVRARLPATGPAIAATHHATLADIADLYDVFLLDSFGVLNIGEQVIPGAPERVAALQAMGKRVIVVTNAAGYPKHLLMQRFARLGFAFSPEDVVSSRETLLAHLASEPARHWGLMASTRFGRAEFGHLDTTFLADDPADYAAAEGFLLFGSSDWTEPRQALLQAALKARPRPVLVGNPDIVAPTEGGLSREPGHFAHRLADATGIKPLFFGKPFAPIFQAILARLSPVDRSRIVMVGDTLHTDILGGAAMGFGTALITGHGSLRGEDVSDAVETSGIFPSHIVTDT
jgi:HAD superfamily hydrolase (TIGR01450 family)